LEYPDPRLFFIPNQHLHPAVLLSLEMNVAVTHSCLLTVPLQVAVSSDVTMAATLITAPPLLLLFLLCGRVGCLLPANHSSQPPAPALLRPNTEPLQ